MNQLKLGYGMENIKDNHRFNLFLLRFHQDHALYIKGSGTLKNKLCGRRVNTFIVLKSFQQ